MAASKKKSTRKRTPAKMSWADAMKKALDGKRSGGSGPDQGKPRDSAVKKLPRSVF